MTKALSDAGRAFVLAPRFAVLATINADGAPQLSVVWYVLRGDVVMMNTARGRVKDRNLRRDPRVSLCIEEGLQYVSLQGTVDIVDDHAATQQDAYDLAVWYDGVEAATQQMAKQFSHEERVTLLMHVAKVFERLE